MVFLAGEYTDLLRGPGTAEDRRLARQNLVLSRAVDLIAELLSARSGMRGLTYWAVGSGDPAWDEIPSPPAPDSRARALVREVYRKRLEPADLVYDPATHALSIHVALASDEAIGDLREFGIFGGDASGATDSGYLFNTGRHPVIHKATGQTLDRNLKLSLAGDGALVGLLDTVGQLLGNQPGVIGVRSVAFGAGAAAWDQAPPPVDPQRKALEKELIRKPVDPRQDIEVRSYQQALVVHTALEFAEAASTLREIGLFGGAADAPVLLDHLTFAPLNHSVAARLHLDVRLEIGIDASIVVPDVTASSLAAATTALAAVGLRPGAIHEQELANGNNTVLRQRPAGGERAVDGASVELTLAVPASIPAPRLIGLTLAEAAPVAAVWGLSIAPDTQQLESPLAAGSILNQTPSASDPIRPGSSIHVTVAIPETTLVPDLTGMRPAEAAVALRNNRLTAANPPFPTIQTKDGWGAIVAQSPAAGTRQVVNSVVTPSLAAPPTLAVPNLVGAMLATAAQTLRDAAAPILKAGGLPSDPAGLAVGQVTTVENATAPGTILNQTPAAGQTTILFGTVDIAVASPITVLVPTLQGLTEQNATTALQASGLLPGAVTRRVDPAPAGTVLSQDPPAGSRISLGSLVNYTVASVIQVRVPQLLAHSVDFAKEALAGSRLVLGTVSRVPTTAAPPGTITAQDQPADKLVNINSTVNITIAGNTVQVPNLVGQSQAAATQLLAGIGLTLAIGAPVETAQVPQGLIGAQLPAVNTTVQVGSAITVNLAIPPRVAVPNLVGKTLQDAQTLATGSKFTLSVSGQTESDMPPGTVAAQSPAAGQLAAPGSAIIVQTAVPRSITIPQLEGLTLAAAQAQAAGLALVVSARFLSDKPAGIITDQSPEAGVKVAPGSTVSVVVSTGIGVRVPSVLGQTAVLALTALRKAGFVVTSEIIMSTKPVNTVINQDPAGGALVLAGSTVDLTIAGLRKTLPDPLDRSVLIDRPAIEILKTP